MSPHNIEGVRTVCVLGMHRSGTSCLTGLLEERGVFLGKVQKENRHNLRGNQENLRLMHLHDAVLADNGSSWDKPPSEPATWTRQRRQELKNILEDYEGKAPWAFKDPRTLFMLEGWLEEIPDLKFIGTFRHPLAVSRSLTRRQPGRHTKENLDLWLRYNEKLLLYWKRFTFDVVDFDLPEREYLQGVGRALDRMKIPGPKKSFEFFESQLRGAVPDAAEALPADVERVYRALREATLRC